MTPRFLALPLLLFVGSLSCTAETASAETKTVNLCAATPLNLSKRGVDTRWARNMLLRELKFERKEKHSPIVIESTPLDSQQRDEAMEEAKDKNCDYVLLTTVMDPVGPGRVAPVIGPNGIEQRPQMIGNDDPRQHIALSFQLIRPGYLRPIVEGVSASPAGDDEGTGPATDAMRSVAARVTSEIRKSRVQVPE
jgi:hypothetical protein